MVLFKITVLDCTSRFSNAGTRIAFNDVYKLIKPPWYLIDI